MDMDWVAVGATEAEAELVGLTYMLEAEEYADDELEEEPVHAGRLLACQ